jgi:DNA repair exonuclease SbcCD ATPase subunit
LQTHIRYTRLGIPAEQHTALIEVCDRISDPGFVEAALKLNKIENESGMIYEEILSRFEAASSELSNMEDKLKKKRTDIKSLSDLIARRNQELANLNAKSAQLQKDAKTNRAKLEKEFDNCKRDLDIKTEEIKEVAKLKNDLSKLGLDLPTLMRLAKEYSRGSSKS